MDTYIGLPFGHSGMGVKEEDIPGLIEYAMKGLSAATNPRIATEDDFEGMIRDSRGIYLRLCLLPVAKLQRATSKS